ncbi:MAG: DNA-protecting protein DprA [bacterium]|nr:DNA-protecting protein DprA [bacterium]
MITPTDLPELDARLAADESLGLRLRLAFASIHPETSRTLLAAHGPAGAVARIGAAKSRGSRALEAVAVAAPERAGQLAAFGYQVMFKGDAAYPPRLASRPDAPDLLFVLGSWRHLPTVAVVGTRRCTPYGRNLATAYGHAIAAAGWVLVSGLARGIDGAAHRGTVAASGVGVAVLGCGLDVAYPREHARLRDELVENGGAVVSEYPPGTPPEAWRFPPRNRIISGSSQAVVVVEAAIKGGALITANTAMDQGVDVFATPGDVGKESAAGANRLIRDGAHPVLEPADLVAELELILGQARVKTESEADWPWEGITINLLASSRGLTVPEAAAALSRAEIAGAVVRHGDHYYPTLGGGS